MGQKPFCYEPLQPRHIRVLDVQRVASQSGYISCKCIHISLDDPSRPPYVAISYSWGTDQKKPHQILVDGHVLSVTQAVYDIFCSKHMTESNDLLWIDAICINQDDKDEKSVQVSLMGDVYSSADHVRVWLGPSGENSSLAMSFTETIYSILPEIETDPERTMYYVQKYPEGGPEWVALANLLNRQWFTRTWVIQEVVMSASATVICGDDTLPWNILARAITGLRALDYDTMIAAEVSRDLVLTNGDVKGIGRVVSLDAIQRSRQNDEAIPLLSLMTVFPDAETKDPLDKVYAFLGVATDAVGDPIFVPDYTEKNSTRKFFTSISRVFLVRDARFDMLRWSGITEKSKVPSWSLNFVCTMPRRELGNYLVTTDEKQDLVFSNDGYELTLRGIIIDSIAQIGSFLQSGHPLGDDETAHYYEWYFQAKALYQSTALRQDEEAFWRTIIANRVSDDSLPRDKRESIPSRDYGEFARDFESIMAQISKVEDASEYLLTPEGMRAMAFRSTMINSSKSRRFSILCGGSVGLMPTGARPGDLIVAFLGASVLFVIRPAPVTSTAPQKYHLVGECYVHNRMDGQVLDLGLESRDIVLV